MGRRPDPALPVEHRALVRETHGERNGGKQRREDYHAEGCRRDVERALEEALKAGDGPMRAGALRSTPPAL